MNILIASATGYLGRRLKLRLLSEEGVSLRLLVPDTHLVSETTRPRVEIVEGDVDDLQAVRQAVKGVDLAYYPIRLFGAVWESDFDKAAVERFRDACVEAGVKRLVFVGLHAAEETSVQSLRNVLETGTILSARPEDIQVIWFRVGVLLGSGSVLFELLRNIVQKVPIIVYSPWMNARVNPVGVPDVVEYLVRAGELEAQGNLVIDIGSQELSFKEMLKVAAQEMGLKRLFIPLPCTAPRLSSFLLMLATPFSYEFSSSLIRALRSGAIRAATPERTAKHYFPQITPHPFDRALLRALHEIENDQVVSRWSDTLGHAFRTSPKEDISRAVYRDVRSMSFGDIPPEKIFQSVKSIGGRTGWFTFDFLWRIRGLLDKLVGGYGTAMGKRVVSDLRLGDMLDVWKVVDLKQNRRLLLEAHMKVAGKAWLEFAIEGNTLTQTAHHYPKGILGRMYWYCMMPFHAFIFKDMIRSIVKRARETD
ncbi:MAG: SDR family oxidoreductase [Nitrospirota bacterium]|jgi:uncharacterized protein YbjT (DUF2867 family)